MEDERAGAYERPGREEKAYRVLAGKA